LPTALVVTANPSPRVTDLPRLCERPTGSARQCVRGLHNLIHAARELRAQISSFPCLEAKRPASAAKSSVGVRSGSPIRFVLRRARRSVCFVARDMAPEKPPIPCGWAHRHRSPDVPQPARSARQSGSGIEIARAPLHHTTRSRRPTLGGSNRAWDFGRAPKFCVQVIRCCYG
jgi:hypothetical protein